METEEMSSEVKEEQELSQEALAAANTEEAEEKTSPAGEAEPTVPLHQHTALRTRAQDAEVAAARAEGALEALQSQQAKTATVSPLDAEIARQAAEGIAEEDMQISPSVIKADKLYEQTQVTKASEAKATQELGVLQVASIGAAKIVHDDWQVVVDAGQKLLSNGEAIDIAAAGENFGEVCYKKCQDAIARNKPVETKAAPESELSKSEAEAKAKAKADAEAKAKAEELKSQEELLGRDKSTNPRMAHVMDL